MQSRSVQNEGPRDGFILIDKPTGPTSHDVIKRISKRFGIKKIGHAGTLDPLATGLLVVLIGQATKFQEFAMSEDKAYEGEILLGYTSNTDDVTGEVVESAEFRFTEEKLETVESNFTGQISQVPPQFSAIKVNGERAYSLAREGENVALVARAVEIKRLDLRKISDETISYSVLCSKGTYVRSLARDIGAALGTGGVLKSIRRTSSGRFSVSDAIGLDMLLESERLLNLRPLHELVLGLPTALVQREQMNQLYLGQQGELQTICHQINGKTCVLVDGTSTPFGIVERSGDTPWKVRFLISKSS